MDILDFELPDIELPDIELPDIGLPDLELPTIDFQLTPSSRTPAWRITVNDNDITESLATRIISIKLKDNRGFVADELEVTLSDHDGKLDIPTTGAKVDLAIGWRGTPLIEKGKYIVDNVTHSGAPDTITVSAKSADFREKLLDKQNLSYPSQDLGDLVTVIADKHDLISVVSESLYEIKVAHKIQANESDANFLTRLAIEHDAIATIKNGLLLFITAGKAQTGKGVDLGMQTITRELGDSHSYQQSDRAKFGGVKAYYYNVAKGHKKWVLAGSSERITSLKTPFKDEQSAKQAAESELKRLSRQTAKFSMNLAFGQPQLFPEVPIKLSGFKPQIDEIEWIVADVEHELSDNGYTTSFNAEVKGETQQGVAK